MAGRGIAGSIQTGRAGGWEPGGSEANSTLLGGLPADVLQFLAGLEANGPTRRDAHFLAGSRIAANTALPGFDLEHPEAAQLDPLAPHHRGAHGVEYGIDGHFRFDLRDLGQV